MSCTRIPSSKALKAIRQTAESGNEHAFVVCDDGSVTKIEEGEEDRIRIKAEDCDPPITIFHTHPNGITKLSEQDRKVLAKEAVDAVCAGNADPNDPKYRCESMDACERSLTASETNQPVLAEPMGCPFQGGE